MELIPIRFGYQLNIGGHKVLLTKKDLDELISILTDDGCKTCNVGGKRRYTKKNDFMKMSVGDYTVLKLTNHELARVKSTLTRCRKLGASFTFRVIGGRKQPADDPDAVREYIIERAK
jgi:hypothetical protein